MTGQGQHPRDAGITGNGSLSGGDYGKIRIVGEAELTGDVRCASMRCTGNIMAAGGLSAGIFKLSGEAVVAGGLQAREAAALGQLQVHGDVQAGHMLVRGYLETPGDGEAERLTVKGAFRIGGLLNAEQLEIRLYGPSSAGEIGGGSIRVGRSRLQALKERLVPSGPPELTARVIEADRVELAYTKADTVRGHRVVIGPGCVIGEVEYSEALEVHRSSKVRSRKKR